MKNNIKKGRLTIYTSYSPGAGKTHIMLRDALQNYGEKVVIGFLNGKERKIKGSNIKPVYHYSLEKIVSKYNFENVVIMAKWEWAENVRMINLLFMKILKKY